MKFSIKHCLLTLIGLFFKAILSAQDSKIIEAPKEFSFSGWNWGAIAVFAVILLIVLIIARAFDIAKIAETTTGKKVIDWNKANATIGVVVFILLAAGCAYEFMYHSKLILLGKSASAHGEAIDSMFRWTFGFTFVVFAITETLLFYFMWKYRYKEGKKASYISHNNTVEVIWSVIPAIVLSFLVLRGFNTWSKITNSETGNAEKIEVFAYQFGWKARYAGADGKLGNSNYNFISATNPLGVASRTHAEELMITLTEDINSAKKKLANATNQTNIWAKELDNLKQGQTAYPEEYKQALKLYNDGKSGVYQRELEREIKRKSTAIMRIKAYMSDKTYFTTTGLDDMVTTEMVLIKNKPYVFKFRARDVIHSAYMPEFRAQMNCVPGMGTQFAFTPIKTTTEAREDKNNPEYDYYLFCNKICGGAHYNMKIKITVVNTLQEQLDWLKQQAPLYVIKGNDAVVNPAAPKTDSTVVKGALTLR